MFSLSKFLHQQANLNRFTELQHAKVKYKFIIHKSPVPSVAVKLPIVGIGKIAWQAWK